MVIDLSQDQLNREYLVIPGSTSVHGVPLDWSTSESRTGSG